MRLRFQAGRPMHVTATRACPLLRLMSEDDDWMDDEDELLEILPGELTLGPADAEPVKPKPGPPFRVGFGRPEDPQWVPPRSI